MPEKVSTKEEEVPVAWNCRPCVGKVNNGSPFSPSRYGQGDVLMRDSENCEFEQLQVNMICEGSASK